MTWVAVAIGGSAVIGAGASMYGAGKSQDAANAGNAMAAGASGLTQQQMQDAIGAQAPYAMMGYGAINPYQSLLTGSQQNVDWDVNADEAKYQDLNARQFELQQQYDQLMGPSSMRSNYRNVREAQSQALDVKRQLDELKDLEMRRTQYQYAQSTPSQNAMMERGGYNAGTKQFNQQMVDDRYAGSSQAAREMFGRLSGQSDSLYEQDTTNALNIQNQGLGQSADMYSRLGNQSQGLYDRLSAQSAAMPLEITDYERNQRTEAANRLLAKQGMLNSRAQVNVMGDLESQLAEKQYGRQMDQFNRDASIGGDFFSRSYGLEGDRYGRDMGARSDYYNRMSGAGTDRYGRSAGLETDQLNRNYSMSSDYINAMMGIDAEDFNRYTGVRSNELAQYYNMMNLGRGASSTQGQFGATAGAAAGNAMTNAGAGIAAAGQQQGYNYASMGAMPMNALNSYLNYQQNQNYSQPSYSAGYSNPYVTQQNPLGLTPGQGL